MGVSTAFRNAILFAVLRGKTLFLFESVLCVLHLNLELLDVFLEVTISFVGVVKSNLELTDVRLELLLEAESLSLTLKGGLHGINGALVALACVVEFFFLLRDAFVDFLSDLAELKLAAKDLVLFLLKGGFSLLKSSLELFLLNFETLNGLLYLMDGSATFTNLVHQVLDLVSESLVLTADRVKMLEVLLVCGLDAEVFGGVVAAFLLGGIELGAHVVNLQFPFTNDPVEVLLLLLSSIGKGLSTFNSDLHVLEFRSNTRLGLLKVQVLYVELFNLLFSLVKTGSDLQAGSLKLLSAGNTFGLILGTPHGRLSFSLGELAENISLAFGFLVKLFAETIKIVLEVAVLTKDGGTLPSFIISEFPGVVNLDTQGSLELAELTNLRFGLFQLAKEISVLNSQLLLGGVEVVKGAVHLIKFDVNFINAKLDGFVCLLSCSLITSKTIKGSLGILSLTPHDFLLLLNLGLHLAKMVDLVGHFCNSIVVLLAETGKGGFVLDVGLFKITTKLSELSFTFLVKLNLSSSGTTGFFKTVTKIVKFTSKVTLGLLSLGTGLALMLNFLFTLLNV